MTCLGYLFLAATAVGTIGSPTQINQREGINLNRLEKSPLAGLSEAEKAERLAARARVGEALADILGFAMGKPVDAYGFAVDEKGSDDPAHPVYLLPKPVMGFTRFRPIRVVDNLYGVLLDQPLAPCKSELLFQEEMDAACRCVQTNLVTTLGLATNDLSVVAEGVPHTWRFSFERWRTSLVLHIEDRELASELARAIKAAAEAEERARKRRLMKIDAVTEEEKGASPQ